MAKKKNALANALAKWKEKSLTQEEKDIKEQQLKDNKEHRDIMDSLMNVSTVQEYLNVIWIEFNSINHSILLSNFNLDAPKVYWLPLSKTCMDVLLDKLLASKYQEIKLLFNANVNE